MSRMSQACFPTSSMTRTTLLLAMVLLHAGQSEGFFGGFFKRTLLAAGTVSLANGSAKDRSPSAHALFATTASSPSLAGVSSPSAPSSSDPTLSEADPEVWGIMNREWERQYEGIELIASENFASKAVMQALGSCMTNKYSEGLPGARYYGGNEHIDAMERLCQVRSIHLSAGCILYICIYRRGGRACQCSD